jgi:hypothetical protein
MRNSLTPSPTGVTSPKLPSDMEAADADLDASPRLFVAEFAQPVRDEVGLADLDHLLTIVHGWIFLKRPRTLIIRHQEGRASQVSRLRQRPGKPQPCDSNPVL